MTNFHSQSRTRCRFGPPFIFILSSTACPCNGRSVCLHNVFLTFCIRSSHLSCVLPAGLKIFRRILKLFSKGTCSAPFCLDHHVLIFFLRCTRRPHRVAGFGSRSHLSASSINSLIICSRWTYPIIMGPHKATDLMAPTLTFVNEHCHPPLHPFLKHS